MIRLVMVASLLAGCRMSLENDATPDSGAGRQCTVSTSQPCMDAVTHSDLAWIESKIFVASCTFSGCHSSATDLGKLDLSSGKSHGQLVGLPPTPGAAPTGAPSLIEPSRKLVVPNDVHASYLMLMLRDFSPDMASPPGNAPANGFMPKGSATLCCQKLDAVERWINAGAPST